MAKTNSAEQNLTHQEAYNINWCGVKTRLNLKCNFEKISWETFDQQQCFKPQYNSNIRRVFLILNPYNFQHNMNGKIGFDFKSVELMNFKVF